MELLKFSVSNSKMNKLAKFKGLKSRQVVSFDLPAGYTCPMASLCLSKADRVTGKITDGRDAQFRCYASSLEAVFKSARLLHWHNFELLRKSDDIASLIEASLPRDIKIVRIHSSGDFFNKKYFQAWVSVAVNHPEISFFGYTKILDYVSAELPKNFGLVYSMGGKLDHKVTNEPRSYVVQTSQDAEKMGLVVSCQENPVDDFDYVMSRQSFALVLHGTQPRKDVLK